MAETGVERQAGIWSASGKFMRFAAMAGALLVAGCQSIIPKGAPTRPEIPTTTPTPVQPGLPTDTERHRIALLVPMSGPNAEIGRAHVLTPVTHAHLVCSLLLEKTQQQRP